MEETAFLTFLSHPSQSIFTLISTVCKKKKKKKNNINYSINEVDTAIQFRELKRFWVLEISIPAWACVSSLLV